MNKPPPAQNIMEDRPIAIPPQKVPAPTLRNLAQELVLREQGQDDWGATAPDQQVAALLDSLNRGRHILIYHPPSESISLISQEEWTDYQLGRDFPAGER